MTNHTQAMTAKYRQDYQAPLYWCDSLDLDFQLQEPLTRVTAISRLRRSGDHNEPLVLDGEGLDLVSVSVDGVPYQQYEQGESSLTLFNLPAECVLTVVTNQSSLLGKLLWSCRSAADLVTAACRAQ